MDTFLSLSNIIKYFSLVGGSWPYLNPNIRISIFIIYIALISSLMMSQLNLFVSRNKSKKELNQLEMATCSGTILFLFVSLSKQIPLYFASSKIKRILDIIPQNLKNITDIKECALFHGAYKEARFWTYFYLTVGLTNYSLFTAVQYLPLVWHYFAPENQTQLVLFQNQGLYPIDILNNQLWASVHLTIVSCVAGTPVMCLDLFYILIVEHVGGLLDIICYKIITVQNKCSSYRNLINSTDYSIYFNKELKRIVQLHIKAIEILNLTEDSFTYSHGAFECICILMIALAGFVEFHYGMQHPTLLIQMTLFCGVFIAEMSCLNIAGQVIINKSENIFISACSGNWYNLPIKCRKDLIILMAYSVTPHHLTAGKLANLSLQHFISVIKTVFSYFAVFQTLLTS